MLLVFLTQTSQALQLTERDALTYLWEFVAWMLGLIGAACLSAMGFFWHWLGRKFKEGETSRSTMEVRVRNEIQVVSLRTGNKIDQLAQETQQMREAFIRLHPDVRLDG